MRLFFCGEREVARDDSDKGRECGERKTTIRVNATINCQVDGVLTKGQMLQSDM